MDAMGIYKSLIPPLRTAPREPQTELTLSTEDGNVQALGGVATKEGKLGFEVRLSVGCFKRKGGQDSHDFIYLLVGLNRPPSAM